MDSCCKQEPESRGAWEQSFIRKESLCHVEAFGIKDTLEVNNQDPYFCNVPLVGKAIAAVFALHCSQCNHYHISALSIQVP